MNLKWSLLVCALLVLTTNFLYGIEDYWNWQIMNGISSQTFFDNYIHLPKNFIFGTATSAYQMEGNKTVHGTQVQNSWTLEKFRPQAGIGNDHLNRFKKDIELLQQLGIQMYRFSVDWSKIEPEEGKFDDQMMMHYGAIAQECIKRGITPMVCLFHFVLPPWFMQKGGFEEVENMRYFVRFAHYVFEHMVKENVHWWMTYNEPIVYAFEGFFRGNLPPSKKNRLILAGNVLKNMYNTHVEIAKSIKSRDAQAQLGICHLMQPLHAFHEYNPLEWAICKFFGRLTNDVTLEFFTTGNFNWNYLVRGSNPDAPASIDYMGINYYSHTIIKQNSLFEYPPLIISDQGGRAQETMIGKTALYPEGLYWAIEKAAKVGKPIFITENGVDDAVGDLRDEFIKKHLFAVSKAIKNGFDVRGYFYWSFVDSFNWNGGFDEKFGLCAVEYENKKFACTLRKGSQPFVNFMRKRVGLSALQNLLEQ